MAMLAPLALGTAGTAVATGAAATAIPTTIGATAGLFGSAGAFSLGTTLSTLGTAFGALGALGQGQAASASADYNARVARENARIAEHQTQTELKQQDRNRRLRLGANIAQAGASGAGLGGSFGDILQSNAMQEELDLMTIKSDGALRAAGYRNDANLSSMKADSAQTSGYIGAGAKLLSGASKIMRV